MQCLNQVIMFSLVCTTGINHYVSHLLFAVKESDQKHLFICVYQNPCFWHLEKVGSLKGAAKLAMLQPYMRK